MGCECEKLDKIDSDSVIQFIKKYLNKLKADGDKWNILYKCKYCNTFWEERDLGGRFGVETELTKVDKNYVKNNYPTL